MNFTQKLRVRLREELLSTAWGYKWHLRREFGLVGPRGRPAAPWHNATLSNRAEWESALQQVKSLGLPLHSDPPKNWDSLAALDVILTSTSPAARILDAGAELYSVLLPWLFMFGYQNLTGVNLAFTQPRQRGPIRYEFGDITRTSFSEGAFDAVTCLSVIEHAVDIESYFKEMARVLKPGGFLITSTDYWQSGVDTTGKVAYGAPVHVFTESEIRSALALAAQYRLHLTSALDLRCHERAVRWQALGLEYTFLVFTLKKES